MMNRLFYEEHFGGAVVMSIADFAEINGHSNSFYGWGQEDDDLYDRVIYHNLVVSRYPPGPLRRYTMLSHKHAPRNPDNNAKLKLPIKLSKYDGLTTLQYRRIDLQLKPLFTHVLVDL